MIRLIATDMDGTLLRSDSTVSPRVADALAAAQAAGWITVPISGRLPFSLRPLAEQAGLTTYAIGANGAVGVDWRADGWLFEQSLEVSAQTALVGALKQAIPGLKCAAVRDGGNEFWPEVGYLDLMRDGDHGRDRQVLVEYDLADVLAEPAVKIVLRRPGIEPEELLGRARALGLPGVHLSISGAPFLEAAAAGVHKGSGLARLCAELGVDRADVVAFGDYVNDVEMLRWAGLGVAVANALPEVKEVADEVAPSNDEDGLAVVLERLLG